MMLESCNHFNASLASQCQSMVKFFNMQNGSDCMHVCSSQPAKFNPEISIRDQVILSYMMESLVVATHANATNATADCVPCYDLQLPALNQLCWKYQALSIEDVETLLSLAYHTEDPNFQVVIDTITTPIVAMKPVTKAASEMAELLMQQWKKAFGTVPKGTYEPIDGVLDVICNTWANPPTTVDALERATDLRSVFNTIPTAGVDMIPNLSKYLNARGFLQSTMKKVCAVGLKVC